MLISPEHKVVRGSIGITFQGAEAAAIGRVYGFANGGVMVNAVTPNGPASKAGVKPGDVIVSIDGKPIKNGDELVADISSRKVGSTVQLGVLRNGQRQTLGVGITDRSKLFADLGKEQEDNAPPTQSDAGEGKLGITVSAVPGNLASKLGIKGGVIVTNVRPGSFADEINLTKGTIITEIDTPASKRAVTDQAAYQSIVSSLKSGDDVAFIVRSSSGNGAAGGPSYLGGTLP
jgi:serine protease Do